MPTERVQLQFTGGPHHGLVVEAPADVVARLPYARFSVLATGQLFDLDAQARISGARVLRRPGEEPPVSRRVPPPARTPDPELAALTFTPSSPPRGHSSPTVLGSPFLAP